jgi:phage tail protein X
MAQYKVKQGDSWERIAGKVYGDQRQFLNLLNANPGIQMLKKGMTINLPEPMWNPYISPEFWQAYSGIAPTAPIQTAQVTKQRPAPQPTAGPPQNLQQGILGPYAPTQKAVTPALAQTGLPPNLAYYQQGPYAPSQRNILAPAKDLVAQPRQTAQYRPSIRLGGQITPPRWNILMPARDLTAQPTQQRSTLQQPGMTPEGNILSPATFLPALPQWMNPNRIFNPATFLPAQHNAPLGRNYMQPMAYYKPRKKQAGIRYRPKRMKV